MDDFSTIDSLEQVNDFLVEDSCIFVDLDNTLIQHSKEFGNAAWEKHVVDTLISKGKDPDAAIRGASAFWRSIQMVSEAIPVEEKTSHFIQELRVRGFPVIGITARSLILIPATHRHLNAAGIQLSVPFDSDYFHLSENVCFSKGVIFCGYASKGVVINQFLKLCDKKVQRVILIDDTLMHLEKAKEEIQSHEFVGLKYNHLDDAMADFTPDQATETLIRVFCNPEACGQFREGLDHLNKSV